GYYVRAHADLFYRRRENKCSATGLARQGRVGTTCLKNEERSARAPHDESWVCTTLRQPADRVGGVMLRTRGWIGVGLLSAFAVPAMAQSFRVQCPQTAITPPTAAANNAEPVY